MARRIANLPADLAIINSELKRLDQYQSQLSGLTDRLVSLETHTAEIRDTRAIPSVNNLIFTWTGGTLTLSWPAGFVQDSSLTHYPVVAGSLVLVASTVYWLAWNPRQQVMAFNTSLHTLFSNSDAFTAAPAGNNLIVSSVKTGTGGQTGVAGGGGSDPGGTGPSGKAYVNF